MVTNISDVGTIILTFRKVIFLCGPIILTLKEITVNHLGFGNNASITMDNEQ